MIGEWGATMMVKIDSKEGNQGQCVQPADRELHIQHPPCQAQGRLPLAGNGLTN